MTIPTDTFTLAAVEALFSDWRATRSGKSRIPAHLWEAVFSLTKDYPTSKILGRLGISRAQFRKQQPPAQSLAKETYSFANLDIRADESLQPVVHVPSIIADHCEIEIKRPDGVSLSIRNANEQLLSTIVASFVG